jgi:hypothetical protein
MLYLSQIVRQIDPISKTELPNGLRKCTVREGIPSLASFGALVLDGFSAGFRVGRSWL